MLLLATLIGVTAMAGTQVRGGYDRLRAYHARSGQNLDRYSCVRVADNTAGITRSSF